MTGELKYAIQYVLGVDRAGNNFTVRPDDVFLVSYPKSGNTWTRFLLGNLVYPEGVSFADINRKVPDPEDLSKRYLKRLPGPRYIKSHQPFDPRFKNVVFIVRDPRDVVLSEYHFDLKRAAIEQGFPLETYIDRFVAGRVSHESGSWGENVGSWIAARQNNPEFRSGRSFLLIRYEEMLLDTKGELTRLALFLGIDPTPERLEQAVERSSAEQMRKLEKAQAHLWSSTKDTDRDKPFVRAARAGGWRNELPAGCAAQIESAWGGLMRELGYPMHDDAAPDTSPHLAGASPLQS